MPREQFPDPLPVRGGHLVYCLSQSPEGPYSTGRTDTPYGAVQAVRRGLTPRRAADDTNLHSPGGGT